MRFAVVLFGAGLTALWAQQPAPPQLTAEQVLEKALAASRPLRTAKGLTSSVAKGELLVEPPGVRGTLELFAKAPAKQLLIVQVESYGEVRRGCDDRTAWAQDPDQGLRSLEGEELADALQACAFDPLGRWRELYPKVELAGKEKVGERETYKLIMTPASGKPVTRYFDAETFHVIRQVSTRVTSEGLVEIRNEFSDYRDVDGFKAAFQVAEITPNQTVTIKITEAKSNVEIDDARFAKPAAK